MCKTVTLGGISSSCGWWPARGQSKRQICADFESCQIPCTPSRVVSRADMVFQAAATPFLGVLAVGTSYPCWSAGFGRSLSDHHHCGAGQRPRAWVHPSRLPHRAGGPRGAERVRGQCDERRHQPHALTRGGDRGLYALHCSGGSIRVSSGMGLLLQTCGTRITTLSAVPAWPCLPFVGRAPCTFLTSTLGGLGWHKKVSAGTCGSWCNFAVLRSSRVCLHAPVLVALVLSSGI